MWKIFPEWGSCKYQHKVNCNCIVIVTDNVFVVQVYIISGGSDGFNSLSSTEILTVGSSEWVEAGALPSARSGLSGVTIDNQFYVLGEW